MSKSKVDEFLETFSEGELFDLIFSTVFPPFEEEEEQEKQEQEKKKRKKRKAKVKKDSPKPPKISEEEVETEDRGRRRRKRNKPWGAMSTDTEEEDFNPYEGRRRTRRGEKFKLEVEPKIEPKIIPYPLPERQAEIEQLTQEMANQTAQKFLDCIPPEIKEVLTEEQIKFQQYELSMGIAEAVRTKLGWAMNQAWLDAKKNNESNSVD